jgi:hypothetical protein
LAGSEQQQHFENGWHYCHMISALAKQANCQLLPFFLHVGVLAISVCRPHVARYDVLISNG